MKPLLLFHQQLKSASSLIEGRLLLIDTDKNSMLDQFIATSGLPGFQSSEYLSAVGRGAIPPQYDVSLNKYTVATSPINLKNVRGVEGDFYKINPHAVLIRSANRSDFGIHFDANVPGSSGCIVIRTNIGWASFKNWMKSIAKSSQQVDLLISYAR